MPQQLQLVIFVLAMTALVVCGCIFTRKPSKNYPLKNLKAAVSDEHQPAVSLSKKKRTIIGRAAEYRTLKKLGRRCDRLLTRDEARRIAASVAKLRATPSWPPL
jgi:ABC-type uncharacterized transport system auxiliary subunit